MKLQTRARLGVLILFAALILLIAGVAGHALMRGLAAAERWQAEEVAQRAVRVVKAECDALRRTALDYAVWDDSVAYTQAPNATYEASNWTAASLSNVEVDLMMLFAPDGGLAGGACVRPGGESLTRPTAGQIAGFAAEVRRVVADASAAELVADLCLVDGKPAFFACQPVLPTSGEGRPQGALVAVRWIDDQLQTRLEQLIGYPVELTSLPDVGAGAEGNARRVAEVEVTLLSDARMAVEAPLLTRDGRALLRLRIELDRVVFQEGMRARRLMLWQLLAAAVVMALSTAWFLRYQVLRRLENLSGELRAIGTDARARGRVREEGSDEITDLARGFNEMIAGLERGEHERDHARQEREHLQEQLLQAQKMEAVGEFAGGIAHDFNNCLTSIVGWMQLTKEELPTDHPAQENVHFALNSVAHATSVVSQLLTYSRHGTVQFAELRLGELLSESMALLRSGLPRLVELRIHAEGVDDCVRADRTQLLQVLMNLINNARDAMSGTGTLTITLSAVTSPSAAVPESLHLPAGAYVRLSVQDTGPGIAPEHLARLFTPFFTTKPAGKGTGLGLAVVQSVVARHQGTVWVESRLGAGATFHVLLPHHATSASPAPVAPAAEVDVRGLRILMAEDDPHVSHLLATAFRRRGCELVVAGDGAEAWDVLTRPDAVFDVVLTDLTMPRLDGLQLGAKIFDSGRKIPVVLMTAYGATLDAEQVRQAGFDGVLSKPLIHDQVLIALVQAVGRRRGTKGG